ncbi:PREDICTED: HORMA domain-containing protein 1 isoform X4 [Corvus brachyrhynchos]|uniref:HORMA domain-containing protein 1 isoform X4 n=1 Tax=Corvus brachyrhynchos TaxID=85066 RepID=UPI00081666D5|nr:PREDICTED: HORMA domain-containing protein 1 isoform X4 [Corvus brachyrhynchos]
MATAQKQRNSVSAVVFPKKIATEQQSLMLVKRLLAVAVSCITYLRGIFPESAYGTRYMDDVCVKILREDKNCPGSTQLVKCKDKKSDSTITCADTKKASILLIRKIYVLMQNLSPLPSDVCLTMKLLYYDEVTPPDYQPPGFREAKYGGMMFNEEPMYLNVGEVPTPFHMLKLRITTEKQRMENVDKNILKQGETAEPLQVCGTSGDDPEEESQDMDEDPVLDNEVEDKNHVNISEAQEKISAHEEEAGGIQTPRVSNPQVDHLTRKTSELIVSESRTRSGKIFQSCIGQQAEVSFFLARTCCPKGGSSASPRSRFSRPSLVCPEFSASIWLFCVTVGF